VVAANELTVIGKRPKKRPDMRSKRPAAIPAGELAKWPGVEFNAFAGGGDGVFDSWAYAQGGSGCLWMFGEFGIASYIRAEAS